MTDLEKIEDQYPELRFWAISVNNVHYHGHIEGNDVYINIRQPDFDWLRTALHECFHHEFDYGDLTDTNDRKVMDAEKWARVAESIK